MQLQEKRFGSLKYYTYFCRVRDYYIYIYLDPTKEGCFRYQDLEFDMEPFYVGKGCSKRYKQHLYDCLNINNKKGYRRLFYQKLRKLLRNGTTPIIIKYREFLIEEEAFIIETELIRKIGRRIQKEGPLCNNSTGGEGPSGSRSPHYKICVYNNLGNIIDIQVSSKKCSEKYEIPIMIIYKHCLGIRKFPIKGLRFRKENDNIEKLPGADEIKRKKKRKNSFISPFSKTLYQFDIKGNFVQDFPNARIAASKLGISRSSIYNNVSGRSKTCNKSVFKYNKN